MKPINILLIILLAGTSLMSCKKFLEENPPSELDATKLMSTEEGILSVLNSVYAVANMNNKDMITVTEWSTDINLERGGVEERDASVISNFTLDANVARLNSNLWDIPYRAIRNANIFLDNIDQAPLSDADKKKYRAEVTFLRAMVYYCLYSWYGPVPLRISSVDEVEKARATDEEMQTFIESELTSTINDLPDPGKEAAYGRAHKGAALGFLVKYYLLTKQWQKVADRVQDIKALNYYELFPNYETMFKVENEGNKEMIWVRQNIAGKGGNQYTNAALPPAFKSDPYTGFVFKAGMLNWAANYRVYTAWYNTFEPGDKRKNLILTQYINSADQLVDLSTEANNFRPMKYVDFNALADHGNDFPFIRYADMLLSRAEALNELNGPNTESIQIINDIRHRAGLFNDIAVGDFASKEALRMHILKERGWELWSEGTRRADLIRMGKLIEFAKARGVTNAQEFHNRLPIPQYEVSANRLLIQNDGY